ncbi:MAG: protein-glutamate O-methyltransferase CheR [Clostridia bacterium]|nr:protein-glutamate O-methyltransferase CheR [Clostridia bacterium]
MDYEGFKAEIYKLTSINLSYYKEKQMKRRIDSLIKKNNYDLYEDYVSALKTNKTLFNEFINYLTINVSEFYRNPEQWVVLESEIFPMLLKKTKTLKIWSAACSTGDEPYTLVMVLNKFLPLESIKITATDIDKEALEKAKNGVYSAKSIENLPKAFIEKYFIKLGENYRVKDEVKRCVEFKQHNLLKDEYPKDYDLIVCRNVLIYFTEEAKNEIYKNFNKTLKTEGILFVGSTEQIIMSNKFNFRPIKTFFYLKEKDVV